MPSSNLEHSCAALLALELDAGITPGQVVLERDAAADLASLIAADLARLVPGAEQLGLAVLGAVYDQAQILRPQWPLFASLAEHYRRAARQHDVPAPIFALGGSSGNLPGAELAPDPALAGGTMLLIPWLLLGDGTAIEAVSARMEQDFVGKGEASAATADWLMRQFGVRLQHARYLTRDDLCALASVQLEHAGFGAAWQLLEAALFTPQRAQDAITASGQLLHYRAGEIRFAPGGYAAWARSDAAAYFHAPAEFTRGFAAWLFELRQYAALLQAHGVALHALTDATALRADAAATGTSDYWIETVAETAPHASVCLYAHELRGLGIVVLSVAAVDAAGARILANAYPLTPQALDAARAALEARYGALGAPRRLGQVCIDAGQQALTIPPAFVQAARPAI